MKLTLPLSLLLIIVGYSFGAVEFSASTERTTISTGESATIVAYLTSNKDLNNPTIPSVPPSEAFDVLRTNQDQSSSSSIQIINGKMTQKVEFRYQFVYVIAPKRTGAIVFPALSVKVNGTTYNTKPITITVQSQPASNPDVRAYLRLSKRSLYLGEQAILQFKVAKRAQASVELKQSFMPALESIEKSFGKAFSVTRLFTDQVTVSSERIDGEMHEVYSLRFAVFPLRAGELTIPAVPFQYQELRRTQRRGRDPFDDFFGGSFFGSNVQAIPRNTLSNTLTITIKPLPKAPQGFSGAVGKFSIRARITPQSVPAGEAATLRINVRGNTRPGNIGEPVLPSFDDYEVFTPEKNVKVDTTENGLVTEKTYKYLLIPKEEGTASIPAIHFPYFDPGAGVFKKVSTSPLQIEVTPGKNKNKKQTRYLTQEEIREVGQDIRYIKTDVKLRSIHGKPYRDPIFFLLFPLPFAILGFSILYRMQSSHRKHNAASYVRQRALRSATKDIQHIRKNKDLSNDAFLGKVATVIERYISRKFGFAATGRTLDELKVELLKKAVDVKVVQDLTTFIERIDAFRFGGMRFNEQSRNEILDKTEAFLSDLEKNVKKTKGTTQKAPAMLLLLLLPGSFFTALYAAPVDSWFEKANHFYVQKQYDSAAVYYERILHEGVHSDAVMYNLGNTYYRQKKIGLSRLYFEKAANLAPNDPDINANINYIKASIVDRVPEPEKGFMATQLDQLHTLFSLRTQLWILLLLLLLIAIFVSTSLFVSKGMRLWFIYSTFLLGFFLIGTGLSAGTKIYRLERVSNAIVLSSTIDAKNQPKGTKVLFSAHEGTKFRIRKTDGEWSLVSLPNGVSGWVENSHLGRI